MAKSAEALIKSELLIWARKSAGMSLEEAASKLGMQIEKLKTWENGTARPTVKQLYKIASVYKQSFAAFYLPEPPPVFKPPLRDYRRIPGKPRKELSAALLLDIRTAIDRREVCLEILSERNQTPAAFKARTTSTTNPEQVGEQIRKFLGVDLKLQRQWKDPRIAFNSWREAIESHGSLVFQSTKLNLSEMRGYSVAEFPLPVIVVNRKDAYAGRIFTMLHELAHLMLRLSGICDLDVANNKQTEEQKIEKFCNHVAGATLVPKLNLLNESIVKTHTGIKWADQELEWLSKSYCTSREVVLRRLLILGLTDENFYKKKREQLQKEWELLPKEKGFVPPSTDTVSKAGKTFIKAVLEAYHDERITISDVSDYLGVKIKHLDTISDAVGLG